MSQKLDGKKRPEISEDISLLCMLSIVDFYRRTQKFTKSRKKIPDDFYRFIGAWGCDRFSQMTEEELSKMIDPDVLSYVRKKTSQRVRPDALRWILRGLAPYDAMRKVKCQPTHN